MAEYKGVNTHAWMAQKDAGIDLIGVDGTMYDQVHPSRHFYVLQRPLNPRVWSTLLKAPCSWPPGPFTS